MSDLWLPLRLHQPLVIAPGPLRVGHCEGCERIVHGFALSEVSGKNGGIGRARMGARKRVPTKPGIGEERSFFDQFADRAEPPVLELSHVELASGRFVLGPSQENIACSQHGALSLDDAAALVVVERRSQALKRRFAGFLDLQEQRSAVAAHEQADRAEGADASHPDHFERHVAQPVAPEKVLNLGREAVIVGGEHALGCQPGASLCSLK